jgi:uncharacterized membrane protein YidH (DUF202 family)
MSGGPAIDRRMRAGAWRTVLMWLGVLTALALAVWGVAYAGIIIPTARQLNDRQRHDG